ncbi:MAG: hypothetical protein JSU07_08810 [Bacteroidetes bacterium]|nr:hypothetical protein [Bacteroidota bacterium]
MKYFLKFGILIALTFCACKKNKDINFTLNTLTLKADNLINLPKQNLYLKLLLVTGNAKTALTTTGIYPSVYTLPAVFAIDKPVVMNFYKNNYAVALYGDSTGFIGSNAININNYKILYPLEMDTENNGLGIVLGGTWR